MPLWWAVAAAAPDWQACLAELLADAEAFRQKARCEAKFAVRFVAGDYAARTGVRVPLTKFAVCAPRACSLEMVARVAAPLLAVPDFPIAEPERWPRFGAEVEVEAGEVLSSGAWLGNVTVSPHRFWVRFFSELNSYHCEKCALGLLLADFHLSRIHPEEINLSKTI